jgi:ABC-type oligopeptide transport system substrate-binding subunit
MRKIKLSLAALALFAGVGVAVAGNMSRVETQDFYVANTGARINTIYPSLGTCTASTENCHALYTRLNPTAPWVLSGSIIQGKKPF